ncbi:hypothetical protein F511_33964 [Dorcoceras hygrometricum]|uniref:Uncharacterized protein n=1 Tax=Dorcoceras hygrometricum TaxID=472368 RepID=A0A2Z7AQ90_9LAMI|nr:hypothetical protein F511_33964 [Dorcoceras hygrometricum]
MTIHRVFIGVTFLATRAWLRPVSRGNQHFTIGGGRLRQSGPRPERRLLRQPALEGLTRSARTDSPRQVGRNELRRSEAAAAAALGGGGAEEVERKLKRRRIEYQQMKQNMREEATSCGDSADGLLVMTSSVTSSSRKIQQVACFQDARGSDVVHKIQSQATVQSADAI